MEGTWMHAYAPQLRLVLAYRSLIRRLVPWFGTYLLATAFTSGC